MKLAAGSAANPVLQRITERVTRVTLASDSSTLAGGLQADSSHVCVFSKSCTVETSLCQPSAALEHFLSMVSAGWQQLSGHVSPYRANLKGPQQQHPLICSLQPRLRNLLLLVHSSRRSNASDLETAPWHTYMQALRPPSDCRQLVPSLHPGNQSIESQGLYLGG